ncbi:hypothetical protein ASF78_17455 [Cellulomonas sp. Leaf334]|nr:hypothetical protein ASF78_17455 [Cellulomonas sp. Leaf334]
MLGAAALTAALLLLPVGAHASGPATSEGHGASVTAADPGTSGPTGVPTDSVVVLGLVALIGAALVVALTGRRPDDDEPTD